MTWVLAAALDRPDSGWRGEEDGKYHDHGSRAKRRPCLACRDWLFVHDTGG